MSLNRLALNLSPEFSVFIEWCENSDNMPEFESDTPADLDKSIICPISLSLPQIPVYLLGQIYDLTSISNPDPQNNARRILTISKEPLTREKIRNPDVEIKPVSIEFRNRISRERKKLAGLPDVSSSNPARLFSQPASVQAPTEDPIKPAIRAIKENRIEEAQELFNRHKLDPDIIGVVAANSGAVHFARYLHKQGVGIQALLNGALAGGYVKFAEELTLISMESGAQFDFSFALIHAAREDRFTDDESCMRLLVEFQDMRIRGLLIRMFEKYGSFLRATDIGLVAPDFHDRLKSIYTHMDDNKLGFDTAYKAMLEQFEKAAPAASLRK